MLPLALPAMNADGAPGRFRRLTSLLVAIVSGLIVLVLPFRNFKEADLRGSRHLARYVDGILSSMAGRTWLITDGIFDNHLELASHARGQPLTLINPTYIEDPIYANYIASLFQDPRLKTMAHMGLHPFLQEWFATDPGISEKVAVMGNPDLWLMAGMVSVPNGPVFLGAKTASDLDVQSIIDRNLGFCAEQVPSLSLLRQKQGVASNFATYALFQLGRSVNDLGVLMQDLERPTDAFMAYSRAREIDPENISALLNQAALINAGFKADDAPQIRKDILDVAANWEQALTLGALSQTYGYVFNPSAFGELGWAWALSGNRAMSIASLEKAVSLQGARPSRAKSFLADIYMEQDQDDASAEIYLEMLEQDPKKGMRRKQNHILVVPPNWVRKSLPLHLRRLCSKP
jgi:tetratricopeptide (TPR) repeat protein